MTVAGEEPGPAHFGTQYPEPPADRSAALRPVSSAQ
jgi:hypothetical protein